jgi:hypothetical protein
LPYVSGKKLNELCPEATSALQDLLDHCLKQNQNERPPSAVEVYLRLQELGKASGILLLPPGAMDRLVAARQTNPGPVTTGNEPTLAYTASENTQRPRLRRRLLLAVLALLLLGALTLAAWQFFKAPPAPPAAETLLGLGIGASQEEVLNAVKGLKMDTGNPWALPHRPPYLGRVLRSEDLGLPAEALGRLEVWHTKDGKIGVVAFEDKVRAIVVQEPYPAATARKVSIGSHAGAVLDAYPEAASEDRNVPVEGEDARMGKTVEVRRYDTLGVGFELLDRKVRAITLYPAAKP